MAAIESETKNGKTFYRVSFKHTDGRRRRLRLEAGTTKRDARTVAGHVVDLVSARANNGTLPPSTIEWLNGVSPELRCKLRDHELLPGHIAATIERFTIKQWFARYLKDRPDIKAGTREQIEITGKNLVRLFGDDKSLERVTLADAKRWRSWLLTSGNQRDKDNSKLSEDTVRRRTGRAKQVFGEAVERGLIVVNPFAKLPSASQVNTTRQRFIDIATINKVIDQAPSVDWRTIIALARFGGLRIPSELSTLRWDRVNLPEGRMMIHAPKTEHHRDGGLRVVPIFPELRPYLEAAWDAAKPGAVFVIDNPKLRRMRANLGTNLGRMIERAGLVRWPKAFQNMRASRETELLAGYPAKDVAAWLGNSEPVALKHYAMATAEQFERATKHGAGCSSVIVPTLPVDDSEAVTDEHEGVGEQGGGNTAPQAETETFNVWTINEESPQNAGYCWSTLPSGMANSYPART